MGPDGFVFVPLLLFDLPRDDVRNGSRQSSPDGLLALPNSGAILEANPDNSIILLDRLVVVDLVRCWQRAGVIV